MEDEKVQSPNLFHHLIASFYCMWKLAEGRVLPFQLKQTINVAVHSL